ncbi:triphosphoribosyl-dephospho-CoA synthetase [Bifidobacterium actinocoloniiforme DSM 22766]|uniref:Probable 2-(5''-triphosphoribosyl)-3'-dephosphocoenzyme-A synthase n=2 Tax=Bifidobacterium actinocoloniiforme TaxID=638619 RepID=A0A086YYN5_9BIFI|nr:triphosphoribosyl-dephospho-CoA synthase [Bifidobacterium actinocoloniiforme DSM 22766]KFI39385.1 triphosphoribosyl-dephospho-CoA synthetase [Bifidobacterium actinocoloniiforme DSM 22766]
MLAPKPGLVDPISNGAHSDMDVDTFLASVGALAPFFPEYLELGRRSTGEQDLYHQLRRTGRQAEASMLSVTGGVNTHKGANFSLGFLLGALGRLLASASLSQLAAADFAPLFPLVSRLAAASMEELTGLDQQDGLSHGQEVYLRDGAAGVRGEACAGYPMLRLVVLPYLRSSPEYADTRYLRLMTLLMSGLEDANLLHRGGRPGLVFVQTNARALQTLPATCLAQALRDFDRELIERHLSPGGSADYLSLAYFFDGLIELADC